MGKQLFFADKGQGLAETAIVLGLFIMVIYGMVDFYHVQSLNHKLFIKARNTAWVKSNKDGFWDRFGNKLGNAGTASEMVDGMMDVNQACADTALDSSLFILPPIRLTHHFYVDRNTWDKDISLDALITDIKDWVIGWFK